jgi:hypothetical protein
MRLVSAFSRPVAGEQARARIHPGRVIQTAAFPILLLSMFGLSVSGTYREREATASTVTSPTRSSLGPSIHCTRFGSAVEAIFFLPRHHAAATSTQEIYKLHTGLREASDRPLAGGKRVPRARIHFRCGGRGLRLINSSMPRNRSLGALPLRLDRSFDP